MHPVNLGLRFLLELAALASLALWGRAQAPGSAGLLWMIGAPGIVIAAWSTFTVPGDPSRPDRGAVTVPGWLRLLLELAVFILSALALRDLGRTDLAAALVAVTLLHYGLSYQRLLWLLRGS